MYVGHKRKEYQVHKGLLVSYEYWTQRLDSELTEDSQTIHLPQESSTIWDLFVNWLYRGSLKDLCMENKNLEKAQVMQYVRLYIKAEKWVIPVLQNKIMDKLTVWTDSIWDWSTCDMIDLIYYHIPEGSPLRSYVVDSFLMRSSMCDVNDENLSRAGQLKSQLDCGNKEFVLECFEALIQLTSGKLLAGGIKMGCTYHKHKDGEKCSNETKAGAHLSGTNGVRNL